MDGIVPHSGQWVGVAHALRRWTRRASPPAKRCGSRMGTIACPAAEPLGSLRLISLEALVDEPLLELDRPFAGRGFVFGLDAEAVGGFGVDVEFGGEAGFLKRR